MSAKSEVEMLNKHPAETEIGLNSRIRHTELELLHALLQSIDYGVLVSGLDRQDIIANRKLSQLFGINAQEVVNTDPDSVRAYAISRVKNKEAFVSLLERAYADPLLSSTDEIELEGEPQIILRRFTAPVYDKTGNPTARLWTFLDITETKALRSKLEEQLDHAAGELLAAQKKAVEMEKLSTAGLLAAGIAHDIRNILSAMQIDLHSLPPEMANTVQDHLIRFSTLTHRLLAFSRPGMVERRPQSVNEIIEGVLSLIRANAELHGVTIHLDLATDLPSIAADFGQMEQLFVNLCLNSLQAMDGNGGTLIIRTRRVRDWIEVKFEDTGTGIASEILGRLFDPFFTTRCNGIGLGLCSCKRIVEDHGGEILAENSMKNGAVFTIMLPAMLFPEE